MLFLLSHLSQGRRIELLRGRWAAGYLTAPALFRSVCEHTSLTDVTASVPTTPLKQARYSAFVHPRACSRPTEDQPCASAGASVSRRRPPVGQDPARQSCRERCHPAPNPDTGRTDGRGKPVPPLRPLSQPAGGKPLPPAARGRAGLTPRPSPAASAGEGQALPTQATD